jgi:hypothetical protein
LAGGFGFRCNTSDESKNDSRARGATKSQNSNPMLGESSQEVRPGPAQERALRNLQLHSGESVARQCEPLAHFAQKWLGPKIRNTLQTSRQNDSGFILFGSFCLGVALFGTVGVKSRAHLRMLSQKPKMITFLSCRWVFSRIRYISQHFLRFRCMSQDSARSPKQSDDIVEFHRVV